MTRRNQNSNQLGNHLWTLAYSQFELKATECNSNLRERLSDVTNTAFHTSLWYDLSYRTDFDGADDKEA